jgi:cholera toxin transcriptional activator
VRRDGKLPPRRTYGHVTFGLFQADLVAGELRKNGERIRLQEQPFQVLGLLLERPGDVVTREQLREKLWPADTFVDFDHSLNTAVNKIREALGDSAANPRFVETLARRGYRFIAPVQPAEGFPSPGPSPDTGSTRRSSSPATGSPVDPVPDDGRSYHPELEVPIPRRSVTRTLFALIQVMYLAFYVVALLRWQEIDRIADSFLPGWGAFAIVLAVWLTALGGIPLRLYLFNAVTFDHRGLGFNFQRLFLLILPLDLLWATAPFLMAQMIGIGAAFAATAALLYLPFSERTLIRLAYPTPSTNPRLGRT